MNQLLPIIRRVRRPLLVVDAPPVVVGNVEPIEAKAEIEKAETLKSPEPEKTESSDASGTSNAGAE